MSSMIGIWIELDTAVKAFFPGQTITGKVIIDTEKSVETTGLKIKYEGKVKVNWSERVTRKDSGRNSRRFVTVFYTAEETYFQNETFLFGDGKEKAIMSSGRTVYQFQYILPDDLPSSFVSRVGVVSYFMEASLLLPWNRSDAVCFVPFTVNGILDLNVEPGATLPYETRKYKSMYCLCCTSGPVGFVFKLRRRCFVPGEALEFTVELSNQSSQRIYGMRVTLMQISKFHAEGNSKVLIRPIRQVQGPQVEPGESEIWNEKMLRIPPIPPSRLATCRIIDVQYSLKIDMALPNLSVNLKDEIPITIGTIPLRDTFASLSASTLTLSPTAPLQESISKPSLLTVDSYRDGRGGGGETTGVYGRIGRTRGNSVSSEHPSFLDYPDLPPPTYQEAILLEKSPDACEENRGFSPDESNGGGKGPSMSNSASYQQGKVSFGQQAPTFVPQYVTYGNFNSNP